MYEATLEQKLITNREFYTPIYDYFQSLIQDEGESVVTQEYADTKKEAAA